MEKAGNVLAPPITFLQRIISVLFLDNLRIGAANQNLLSTLIMEENIKLSPPSKSSFHEGP